MATQQSPLRRAFEELPAPGDAESRFLLINQAAWPLGAKAIRALRPMQRLPLFGSLPSACEDGATPFLVRAPDTSARESSSRLLKDLFDTGCYASGLHCIDTRQDIQQLARRLTVRCDAVISEGQEVVLRFFDARVLEILVDELTESQRSAFLACGSHWWFASRSGQLIAAEPSSDAPEDPIKHPLELDVAQEGRLVDASEADAVLDILSRRNLGAMLDLPYPQRHPCVKRLLEDARGWGLKDISDLVSYSALGLLRGRGFHQAEPWRTLLPAVQRGETKFETALRQVAEQVSA